MDILKTMASISKPTQEEFEKANDLEIFEEFWDQHFGTTYKLKDISDKTKEYFEELSNRLGTGVGLDSGCGTGRVKKLLEDNGWTMYGIDISNEALNEAAKITPDNLSHASAHELPFKDLFFDLVISWRVLHNIPRENRFEASREAARVLRPGGMYICSVQAKSGATFEAYSGVGIERPEDLGAYIINVEPEDGKRAIGMKKCYDEAAIKEEIVSNAGLKIKKLELIHELSGMKAREGQANDYWLIEAVK